VTAKPILAVDVDGVISLFDFDEPPVSPAAKFELVDDVVHCISVAGADRLRQLADHYDLVWATGWEAKVKLLATLLDLPEYPHLTFGGAARFGSADWKLGPLEEFARDRPLAWIDDSFDERCYEWARGRREPTLLVPTEPHVGLEDVQAEALVAWARSLENDSVDRGRVR
jgi:hypothetical protein